MNGFRQGAEEASQRRSRNPGVSTNSHHINIWRIGTSEQIAQGEFFSIPFDSFTPLPNNHALSTGIDRAAMAHAYLLTQLVDCDCRDVKDSFSPVLVTQNQERFLCC